MPVNRVQKGPVLDRWTGTVPELAAVPGPGQAPANHAQPRFTPTPRRDPHPQKPSQMDRGPHSLTGPSYQLLGPRQVSSWPGIHDLEISIYLCCKRLFCVTLQLGMWGRTSLSRTDVCAGQVNGACHVDVAVGVGSGPDDCMAGWPAEVARWIPPAFTVPQRTIVKGL